MNCITLSTPKAFVVSQLTGTINEITVGEDYLYVSVSVFKLTSKSFWIRWPRKVFL